MIFDFAIPEPRTILENYNPNCRLYLPWLNREMRAYLSDSKGFVRILREPLLEGSKEMFPRTLTWINPKTDIIIRDFSTLRLSELNPDYVERGNDIGIYRDDSDAKHLGSCFKTNCMLLLSGLSQLQHLAIGIDNFSTGHSLVWHMIQVSCPKLKSLTLFLQEQMKSFQKRIDDKGVTGRLAMTGQELKLVDLDSNLIDFAHFATQAKGKERFEACQSEKLLMRWKYATKCLRKNWKRYYPTILFFIIGNMIYDSLTYNYALWEVTSPKHKVTLSTLFTELLIWPLMILSFLSKITKLTSWLKKGLFLLLWIAIVSTIELLINMRGLIAYHNGWTIWSSVFSNFFIYPLVFLHHKYPLWALLLTAILGISALFILQVPISTLK